MSPPSPVTTGDWLSSVRRTSDVVPARGRAAFPAGAGRPRNIRASLSLVKISEDAAEAFIVRNLSDRGLGAWREDETFRVFRDLVTDGKLIAAAEEYQKVTGAKLSECHLAVTLAVRSEPKSAAE